MTTIHWTTTIDYKIILDDEDQAEWDALTDDDQRDAWLADHENDDTYDAVTDRIFED